ncbi:MAG: hypothetical protein CVU00_00495 [Bacteroidetes bacterium HGW-Bacteroidetes-17]|jgi:rhodanese-related sulfurtransferase|nr:MAG: hypothetical protein CVU00_00495 [Bacteroidetes bacterium HGW-Bacteroidetes-17]
MNLKYSLLAAILVILGFVLLILPAKEQLPETNPEVLQYELNEVTHFISTDKVAERIINQDPTLLLIDVRMADDYLNYSLPGAENIPLKEILHPDWDDLLNQTDRDIVFYSNADVYAEQAWMFARRKGYKKLFVMQGGLNNWFATIIQPTEPPETSSTKEIEAYQFRKAAGIYFCGGQAIVSEVNPQDALVITRKNKKTKVEGGC